MKERKKEPGYDNDNLFMELHKEHGDIFRFRMPGIFSLRFFVLLFIGSQIYLL